MFPEGLVSLTCLQEGKARTRHGVRWDCIIQGKTGKRHRGGRKGGGKSIAAQTARREPHRTAQPSVGPHPAPWFQQGFGCRFTNPMNPVQARKGMGASSTLPSRGASCSSGVPTQDQERLLHCQGLSLVCYRKNPHYFQVPVTCWAGNSEAALRVIHQQLVKGWGEVLTAEVPTRWARVSPAVLVSQPPKAPRISPTVDQVLLQGLSHLLGCGSEKHWNVLSPFQ